LFNDFQISAIDKEEVVEFDLKWKLPCILYYKRIDINERYLIVKNHVGYRKQSGSAHQNDFYWFYYGTRMVGWTWTILNIGF